MILKVFIYLKNISGGISIVLFFLLLVPQYSNGTENILWLDVFIDVFHFIREIFDWP